MTAQRPAAADLTVGAEVVRETVEFDRAALVRYAGASGDRNPIHWNERFALEVGLPGVIAHGMLTMGAVIGPVVRWAGDPGAVLDYVVRFSRPVVVPDPGAVAVEIVAVVGSINADERTARIDLTVTCDGAKVLGKAQAQVALA